jgi:hypothetical protein
VVSPPCSRKATSAEKWSTLHGTPGDPGGHRTIRAVRRAVVDASEQRADDLAEHLGVAVDVGS